MHDDRMEELLHQADRAAPPPQVSPYLPDIVRRLARRRRITSLILSAAALLVAAFGAALIFDKLHHPVESPSPQHIIVQVQHDLLPERTAQRLDTQAQIAQLRVEVAQLRAEADMRTEILRQILAYQQQQARLAQLERQLTEIPDPLDELHKQLDNAAFTTLYLADRKYNELNLKDSALRDYQQIIELYPQSRWAQTARQRLLEIKNTKSI